MAVLHPFRAVRPVPEYAARIACVPYDVVNTEEARELADGNPLSFLHIIRPEIDLASGISEDADVVYERGAQNLKNYTFGPYSLTEPEPSLYLYRLVMDGREQTGVYGCVSVRDYDQNVILKHERTRPAKEDDRTRHIITQRAHAEPIMLTFGEHIGVRNMMSETASTMPLYDVTADDGIRHTIWKVADPARLQSLFSEIDKLYIADGHHRCKAASRAAAELGGAEDVSDEINFFPAVLFPMKDMNIMAYNRIIRKLPMNPARFLDVLREQFVVTDSAPPAPTERGCVSVYLAGFWYGVVLPDSNGNVADRLDVGRLTKHIIEPLLGITDPRRDPNIDFVGGIRGTRELERLVDDGQAEMAISMFPTDIQDLVDISDAGLLMPPKTTWFEPKLRSGFLVHPF